ncbi:translationally-controlled tumor protein [Protopterus annectens]|uniref:translationally-controlled tumor protein n=1 Tax=Protopterus annectens TaxID=7888 RepID=UPI001CF9CFE5|nr:translationally-controlled tumor protein [Protopterus annectens]
MKIYRDSISGDEMFSDIYKVKLTHNGMLYEVEGKTVSRTENSIDNALIGGNPSEEGGCDEGLESTTVSGVDLVLNHKLQEVSFSKESFKNYIKGFVKQVKCKLEETDKDRAKAFTEQAPAVVKHLLSSFNDLQFFTGESYNLDGMVAYLNYREDGITPFMLFFKDGLIEEKC